MHYAVMYSPRPLWVGRSRRSWYQIHRALICSVSCTDDTGYILCEVFNDAGILYSEIIEAYPDSAPGKILWTPDDWGVWYKPLPPPDPEFVGSCASGFIERAALDSIRITPRKRGISLSCTIRIG